LDTRDFKRLAASGYDQIVDTYFEQFGHSTARARKFDELTDGLAPHGRVLDLGCGAGLPVARDLVARGFEVTAVDGSARQIERARRNVPQAQFIQADMTIIEFPACAFFDAVSGFYSITHVPRDEHAALLHRTSGWLRSGGRFLERMPLVQRCAPQVHLYFFGTPDLIGSRLQRNASQNSPNWLKGVAAGLALVCRANLRVISGKQFGAIIRTVLSPRPGVECRWHLPP
jgi:SAM-dependent methyltransferase